MKIPKCTQLAMLSITLIIISRCEPSGEYKVSYAHDIQPIFTTNCNDCHGPGGAANLDLSSHAALLNRENDNPPVLIPYDAEHSLLYEKVARSYPSIGVRMPLGRTPLSSSRIELIGDWITEGALDN